MKYLKLLVILLVISNNLNAQTWHRIRKEYDLVQLKNTNLNHIDKSNIEIDTAIGTNFGFKFVAFSQGVPIYFYNDRFYLIKIKSLTYVTGWVTDSLDLIYIDRIKSIKND